MRGGRTDPGLAGGCDMESDQGQLREQLESEIAFQRAAVTEDAEHLIRLLREAADRIEESLHKVRTATPWQLMVARGPEEGLIAEIFTEADRIGASRRINQLCLASSTIRANKAVLRILPNP
jgi:hypothetical protein